MAPDSDGRRILKELEAVRAQLDELRWSGLDWIPCAQAARRLGASVSLLAHWRVIGRPALRYCKVGKQIMYCVADINAFLRSRAQTKTTEDENVKAETFTPTDAPKTAPAPLRTPRISRPIK